MELKRCKAAAVTKDEEEEDDTKMELKRCKTTEKLNSIELKRCNAAAVTTEEEAEAWLSGGAPDDILVEILMRLPSSKYALECKLVSKRWNSVLSKPSFLRQAAAFHRQCKREGDGGHSFSLIFQLHQLLPSKTTSKKNPVFAFRQDNNNNNNNNNGCVRPLHLHRLIGISSSPSSSECVLGIGASCDDLVVVVEKKNKECKYYVVNVQTHEWIALPPPPPSTLEEDKALGTPFKVGLLCHYDSAAFKVIRIGFVTTTTVVIHQTCPMFGVDRSHFSVHIYSSDSKNWAEYVVDWYPFRFTHYLTQTPIISHNGMFHWVNGRALLSLNPFDLVFDDHPARLRLNRTIELPEKNFYNDLTSGLLDRSRSHGKVPQFLGIGVVRGHLRIITVHIQDDDGHHPLLVWQLDESQIGAAHANAPWSLVYSVSIKEFPPLKKVSFSFDFMACHPYEGDVLFVQILNSVYQMNLRTRILTKAKQVKPYKGTYCLSIVLPPLLHQWLPTQLTCFL